MLKKSELKQWTDALRSGEYEQGKSYLKRATSEDSKPKYCCLGVLCEINNVPNRFRELDFCYGFGEGCHQTATLPFEVDRILSMSNVGVFDYLNMPKLDLHQSLAKANDAGVSFIEIADHLDKYYPAVEG